MAIEGGNEAAYSAERKDTIEENERNRRHVKEVKKMELDALTKASKLRFVKSRKMDVLHSLVRSPVNVAGVFAIMILILVRRDIPEQLWESIK